MQCGPDGVPRRRGAFTLVEVVLALAVAGLVMATVHRLLTTSYRQGDYIVRAQADREAMATLAEILRADLTAFCPVASDGRPVELRSRSALPGAPQSLSFTTAAPRLGPAPAQEPLARRVAYLVTSSSTGTGVALQRDVAPFPGEEVPPRSATLTPELGAFRVEVFDGEQWYEVWPPEEEEDYRLPRAVRVKFAPAGGEPETELTVPLDCVPLARLPLLPVAGENAGGGGTP